MVSKRVWTTYQILLPIPNPSASIERFTIGNKGCARDERVGKANWCDAVVMYIITTIIYKAVPGEKPLQRKNELRNGWPSENETREELRPPIYTVGRISTPNSCEH